MTDTTIRPAVSTYAHSGLMHRRKRNGACDALTEGLRRAQQIACSGSRLDCHSRVSDSCYNA